MNTILLVEDSVTDTQKLTQCLKQLGLMVINARDGEEAEEQLKRGRPDLVILDVILPGRSGFELCRELKRDPQTQEIPVVLCSTKTTDADKIWGKMLWDNHYIPKPVDEVELLSTVRRLIRI